MTSIILAAIFGICHGDAACIESVKDLYPQSKVEVVHAYESLYEKGKCNEQRQ